MVNPPARARAVTANLERLRHFVCGLVIGSLSWLAARCTDAAPPITALAAAPDGKSIVVGSQMGLQVRRWPTLEVARAISIELPQIHDFAFSPTGDVVAVAGGDPAKEGNVVMARWPTGEVRARHAVSEDLVYSVDWRSDGKFWAAAGFDGIVYVYDAPDNRLHATLVGHSAGVLAVRFLPGTPLLVSAGMDHTIRVWEVGDGKLVRTLDNHTGPVHSLAVRPDSSDRAPLMIASAGGDRTVRLWQPTIGRLVRFVQLKAAPLCVAWLPDGKRLFAACTDGRVRTIDPQTASVVRDEPAIHGWAYSLIVHPDGQELVVGGVDGEMVRRQIIERPR